MFCKALMFSHLREALLCEGRGFSITLGYFINRTAGARLPDLLPPPAVCVWACGDQMADNQSFGKTGSLVDSSEPKAARCCLSRLLSRGNFEKLFVCSWILKAKGCAFLLFFFLSLKWKKRPFRLTAPFILYYPAWLLTPGELCSQIDALLLWGCSWNIKLYWNIHMWVHLAESNWCATPQTPNGNVAGPQHALADTLSSGQDSDWDLAKATKSDLGWRLPDSGRLMSASARWPENIWCCAATWNFSRILGQIKKVFEENYSLLQKWSIRYFIQTATFAVKQFRYGRSSWGFDFH